MGPPDGYPASDAWIGLTTYGDRRRYFIDGNACPFRKWYPGIDPENRPKSAHRNKNCTLIDSEGEWDVEDCNLNDTVRAFVCKKRAGFRKWQPPKRLHL
ncbi:unnamed protein product [Enterobius vermicularis]|uniref:C-type lectin domain-containing protein n=1 Tax=Enterobius vermicularis TaxID=51028 RepID=A0A0N4UX71_ENTVE|nr:unnamed protein product [Enterobius vermicularis]